MLGEAGEGAEVGAAELRDLGGLPADEAVAACEGFEHPGVDGEGCEFARAEEQDAVGDFLADAGEFEQTRFRGGVGEVLGLIEPAGVCSEEECGLVNEARAEAELAGAEIGFGNGGELRPWRQSMMNCRRGFMPR